VSDDSHPCGLGNRLSDAQRSGFFSWFCLSAVSADEVSLDPAIGSAQDCRFRPSGQRFHQLVELAVRLDESECIRAAHLGVARSFIDAPAIRPFARDVAKSFLNWALPTEAGSALRREIALIGAFADGESVVISHPVSYPAVPRTHWLQRWMDRRHEAAVFMGRRTRSQRRVGHIRIAFENWAKPSADRNYGERPDDVKSLPTGQREGWLFMRISSE
jgi:hypothetical protein